MPALGAIGSYPLTSKGRPIPDWPQYVDVQEELGILGRHHAISTVEGFGDSRKDCSRKCRPVYLPVPLLVIPPAEPPRLLLRSQITQRPNFYEDHRSGTRLFEQKQWMLLAFFAAASFFFSASFLSGQSIDMCPALTWRNPKHPLFLLK
jgi:hypothetical protein